MNLAEILINVSAAFLGTLIGAAVTLKALGKQRRADRSLHLVDAVAQMSATLLSIHQRLTVFRAQYPKTNSTVMPVPKAALDAYLRQFADDSSVLLREHGRIIVLADDQAVIDAAHAALASADGVMGLSQHEKKIPADEWALVLDRIGESVLELKRITRTRLEALPALRITALG